MSESEFSVTLADHNPSGSIKANIGHIEAGSGIAGIIKAVLVLERGIIPPNALLDNINTEIDMDFYNLKVSTTGFHLDDMRI